MTKLNIEIRGNEVVITGSDMMNELQGWVVEQVINTIHRAVHKDTVVSEDEKLELIRRDYLTQYAQRDLEHREEVEKEIQETINEETKARETQNLTEHNKEYKLREWEPNRTNIPEMVSMLRQPAQPNHKPLIKKVKETTIETYFYSSEIEDENEAWKYDEWVVR